VENKRRTYRAYVLFFVDSACEKSRLLSWKFLGIFIIKLSTKNLYSCPAGHASILELIAVTGTETIA
jgi:hypothetical protein